VEKTGYIPSSIPELVDSPGNSGVKPLYFFEIRGFWAVANNRRREIPAPHLSELNV
jgi:hypothetical protein